MLKISTMGLAVQRFIFVAALVLAVASCNSQDDSRRQDHVWQEQTDALESAGAVEDIIRESAEQQRRQIEQQTQE